MNGALNAWQGSEEDDVRARTLFCIALPTVWAAVIWNGTGQRLSRLAMISEARAQAPDATVDVWRVENKVDKLADTTTLQATAIAAAGDENFEVTAQCDSGSIDIAFAVFPARGNGTLAFASKAVGTRLDQGEVFQQSGNIKFSNEIHLILGPSDTQHLESATVWRVKLPLNVGDPPVIALNLRSTSFRRFLLTCMGTEARRQGEAKAQAQRDFFAALAGAPLMQSVTPGVLALRTDLNSYEASVDQNLLLPGQSLVKVLETQREPTYGYLWSRVVGVDQNGNPLRSHNGVIIQGWTRADALQQPGAPPPPNSATSIYLGGPRGVPPHP